ncbi:MFS transporter [Cupriavidus plantarum]|uniref:MFS transporter n=1 Tax=Cupriavidus plantarum TaxID=942865 RepID=UPI0035C75321
MTHPAAPADPNDCPALPSPPPIEGATMPRALLMLFAVASGLSVANVYYAQPLLDAIARDLGIAEAAVGGVVTMTQIGCALALVLLVPLGDRLDRRRLMMAQLAALAIALVAVAAARTTPLLYAGMIAVGMLGTAMTQGLIAYAASTATGDLAREQGRIVGAAQSGVFIGLLGARVFSGAIGDLAGWRGVYLVSALLMLALAVPLWRSLPRLPAARVAPSFTDLLVSMFRLLREERILRQRGLLALVLFAALNIFWSALVLPLSAPPFSFPHTVVGAFGLVGIVGALAAARAGHWVDSGHSARTTTVALIVLLLAWWPLSCLEGASKPIALAALVLGIVLLDAAAQALHVTNQSLILRNRPEAAGRLIGLYMLYYAVGSGLGAIGSTMAYARGGWLGVCALGAGISAIGLVLWSLRRR